MASFQTTPAFYTVLDVVNMCLRSIGTDSVDSYENSEDADVGAILAELNSADLVVQLNSGDGYGWNSNDNWLLPLSPDGTISLPAGTLSVSSAYLNTTSFVGQSGRLLERPTGKLYDAMNNTGIFTTPQLVDIVLRMDFETLPQIARQAIGTLGAYTWQSKYQGAQIVTQVTKQQADDALADLWSFDDSSNTQNSINANKAVFSRLYGNRGLFRNRQGQ